MVFNHRDNWALIDGEVGSRVPVGVFAERIDKAEATPDAPSRLGQEATQGAHRLIGHIGKTGQGGTGCDDANVPIRSMGYVARRPMRRGEPPAVETVTLMAMRVENAMPVIDPRVANVLLPIVGMAVSQVSRIEAAEGIVREKQRPAIIYPERQFDAVMFTTVAKTRSGREAMVVAIRIDWVMLRTRRQNESKQALVPTLNRDVHCPLVRRAPVPIELALPRKPIPLGLRQQRIYATAKPLLLACGAVKMLAGTDQALKQKRRFDEIGAIILASEGNGGARAAVDKMREHAMVAWRTLQQIEHSMQPAQGVDTINPAALDSNDDRHDPKAGTADRNEVVWSIACRLQAIAREAADWVTALPEIAGGLPLHGIEQLVIGK